MLRAAANIRAKILKRKRAPSPLLLCTLVCRSCRLTVADSADLWNAFELTGFWRPL